MDAKKLAVYQRMLFWFPETNHDNTARFKAGSKRVKNAQTKTISLNICGLKFSLSCFVWLSFSEKQLMLGLFVSILKAWAIFFD